MQRSKLPSRRNFIKSLAGGAAGMAVMPSFAEEKVLGTKKRGQISCTSYPWFTFYNREGKEWMGDPEVCINDYLNSGLKAHEPGFDNAKQVEELAPMLIKKGIAIPSIYVGTTLHDPASVQENIDQAVSIALAAKKWGTKIIVTNPSPIRWGIPEDKDDAALTLQGESLEKLGAILAGHNMTVAFRAMYHSASTSTGYTAAWATRSLVYPMWYGHMERG
jgi:inosose dehydratase